MPTNKLAYAEERLLSSQADLDNAKTSREDLYDKYVESRYDTGLLVKLILRS